MQRRRCNRILSLGIVLVSLGCSAMGFGTARADTLTFALNVSPAAWGQPLGEDLYTDGYSPAYSWRAYRKEAHSERHWEKRQRKAEHRYWKARRKYYKRMYKAQRKYDRSIYGY